MRFLFCPSIDDIKSHGIMQSGTTLKIGGSQ
nr:MAG TPA: protein of unknown function (DUF4949) [Caudoviricetes sp.]